MTMINISHLTFSYPGGDQNIFDDVSLQLNTSWKLGLVGRNGTGKTTFLRLLQGQYEYEGTISAKVSFDYFPFTVPDQTKTAYEIVEQINPAGEIWRFEREVSLLGMDTATLERPFKTLSQGEQTRILLAALFSKEHNFLLIDEPTNHLDIAARQQVAQYLQGKEGFILVSHDRTLLNQCTDHTLAINRTNITLAQGNFATWYENKMLQDDFERAQNKKLGREITKLQQNARQTAKWADQIESTIIGGRMAKGHISRMSAKMMKRSIIAQNRAQKNIEEKSKLLKNIEETEPLKFHCLQNIDGRIFEAIDLTLSYGQHEVAKNINFYLENGDRLQIRGKNGSGKSSILKLLLEQLAQPRDGLVDHPDDHPETSSKQTLNYEGHLRLPKNLKISYVSQDTSRLKGSLKDYIFANNLDQNLFQAILRKLDLERECFNKNLESYSAGQKKKVLLAHSLTEEAHIYIWDEPLNYIDIFSRMQIEEAILKYQPTMIFVEHDQNFAEKIATKVLDL